MRYVLRIPLFFLSSTWYIEAEGSTLVGFRFEALLNNLETPLATSEERFPKCKLICAADASRW